MAIGIVKIESPTVTFMPSTIARVSGIFMEMVVPSPQVLDTETIPPKDSTFFFTTSIPTPRPEYSVTAVLVENPGSMISPRISFWLYSEAGLVSIFFAWAFSRIFWGSMPYPSSFTEMTTSLLVWEAERTISPWGSLPASIRSWAVSSIP